MRDNRTESWPGASVLRRWLAGWPGAARVLAAAAVSAGLAALALWQIDWPATWAALSHIRLGWLLAALSSVALATLCRAERWRWLFSPGHRPARLRLLGMVWVGQALNALIPARLGELARAWLAARAGPADLSEALWTLAAEKLLDSLTLLAAVVAIAMWAPLPAWLRSGAMTLAAATLAAVGALLAVAIWRATFTAWWTRQSARRAWLRRVPMARLLDAIAQGAQALRHEALGPVACWSALGFMTGMFTNWLTARALGIDMSWIAAALLLAVLQMSAVLPVPTLPGRAGLFHYLCVLTLGLYGVARAPALGYALILHALTYLPMAIGGPISLAWLQRNKPRR